MILTLKFLNVDHSYLLSLEFHLGIVNLQKKKKSLKLCIVILNFIQFRGQSMTSLHTSVARKTTQARKYSYPCCGRVAYVGFLSTLDYGKSESTLEVL